MKDLVIPKKELKKKKKKNNEKANLYFVREYIITIIPLNEGRKYELSEKEVTLELKRDFMLQYEPFKC